MSNPEAIGSIMAWLVDSSSSMLSFPTMLSHKKNRFV